MNTYKLTDARAVVGKLDRCDRCHFATAAQPLEIQGCYLVFACRDHFTLLAMTAVAGLTVGDEKRA